MKLILPTILALILLTGCIKPPLEGRLEPFAPAQVHFADFDLQQHTTVGIPKTARDEAGLLHVTVPLRAATDLQLYIDYRVTFFDTAGQLLSQTGWFTKTLTPNVFDQISVASMSPRAADFQIDIRYAQ